MTLDWSASLTVPPRIEIVPSVIGKNPIRALKIVDFPAPFIPTNPLIDPLKIENEAFFMAV